MPFQDDADFVEVLAFGQAGYAVTDRSLDPDGCGWPWVGNDLQQIGFPDPHFLQTGEDGFQCLQKM